MRGGERAFAPCDEGMGNFVRAGPARSAQEAPRGPAAAARRGARGGRYHGRALGGDDAPGREGTGGMLVAVGGGGVGGGRAVSKPPKRRASSSPPTPKNALPRSSL